MILAETNTKRGLHNRYNAIYHYTINLFAS